MHLYLALTSRNHIDGDVEDFVPTKFTYAILFLAIAKSLYTETVEVSNQTKTTLLSDISTSVKVESIDSILRKSPNYFDALIKNIFNDMRSVYDIEPDDVIVSSINALFSPQNGRRHQQTLFFADELIFSGGKIGQFFTQLLVTFFK